MRPARRQRLPGRRYLVPKPLRLDRHDSPVGPDDRASIEAEAEEAQRGKRGGYQPHSWWLAFLLALAKVQEDERQHQKCAGGTRQGRAESDQAGYPRLVLPRKPEGCECQRQVETLRIWRQQKETR